MKNTEMKIIDKKIKNNPFLGTSLDEDIKQAKKEDEKFAKLFDEEMFKLNIAKQVRELRKKKKLTQVKLAQKAETTQPVIARIEKGENKKVPSYGLLIRIANALGVEFYYGFAPKGKLS